jgi:hypothetical protein
MKGEVKTIKAKQISKLSVCWKMTNGKNRTQGKEARPRSDELKMQFKEGVPSGSL